MFDNLESISRQNRFYNNEKRTSYRSRYRGKEKKIKEKKRRNDDYPLVSVTIILGGA
jgi:hypothetical protein